MIDFYEFIIPELLKNVLILTLTSNIFEQVPRALSRPPAAYSNHPPREINHPSEVGFPRFSRDFSNQGNGK